MVCADDGLPGVMLPPTLHSGRGINGARQKRDDGALPPARMPLPPVHTGRSRLPACGFAACLLLAIRMMIAQLEDPEVLLDPEEAKVVHGPCGLNSLR